MLAAGFHDGSQFLLSVAAHHHTGDVTVESCIRSPCKRAQFVGVDLGGGRRMKKLAQKLVVILLMEVGGLCFFSIHCIVGCSHNKCRLEIIQSVLIIWHKDNKILSFCIK